MGMMSIRRMSQKLLAPVVIVLVVAMTIGLFYIGFPMSRGQNGAYRGPSVKIDGRKINDTKFNEYIAQASQQASQYAQYGMQYSNAQIRDLALTIAVRENALQREEKNFKIKVSNKEAEKLLNKYFPTEEELKSYMEKQGLTSKKQLIKEIVKMLEEQKLYVIKAKQSKIKVAKADVEGYMEQITVSHILVGTKDSSGKELRTDAEAEQRAQEVYQKVSAKGDFAQLAKEYSDDPGSKDKGGVYGPMALSQFKSGMVKEFVDAALGLKIGQFSKPIKTQYGYHIIKLDQLSTPKGSEYKNKYKEISESLLLQKFQESPAYSDWMKKITEATESKMEILDPAIRAYRLGEKEKWAEASEAYDKALKRNYYKEQWDLYLDAAKANVKAKKFGHALQVLHKIPAENQDMLDYQTTLASVYQENKHPQKAAEILLSYGAQHGDDLNIHQQLEQILSGWKLTAAAAKETALVARLKQKEADAMKKTQQDLAAKNGQAGAATSTTPAANATPQPAASEQPAATQTKK